MQLGSCCHCSPLARVRRHKLWLCLRADIMLFLMCSTVEARCSLGPAVDILSYSEREWRGDTAKSALIRKVAWLTVCRLLSLLFVNEVQNKCSKQKRDTSPTNKLTPKKIKLRMQGWNNDNCYVQGRHYASIYIYIYIRKCTVCILGMETYGPPRVLYGVY